ncbi:type 2 lanthipeptide synthetase LanM family protein [Candidatus Enterococcus ikei]|uniref:Type 2 lantipeptide synthetase LanM family protein n=1 Tax=Candidatus Enterococcus ikei TaxID=2815326 RepID=A0ABS3GXC2_9ENTE|nr:type 2 lanthipeptide synthetase LanM family protein [Enterococcus sp. DIV0869a]MBO0439401.1 type 2 lantipeptide synthetase LanM family protein [Enterococcus sp. DIV0869a]
MIFFDKYPGLLRILGRLYKQSVNNLNTIVKRIYEDKKEFSLFNIINTDKIKNLFFGQGDSHNGGQMVCIIEFDDGKVVYKPRECFSDLVLNNFIYVYNLNHDEKLKTVNIIERNGYYWMEYVHSKELDDPLNSKEFYEKAGVLLAFMYVLNGQDIHYENLIAYGNDPVIIDAECIFAKLSTEGLSDTVLDTQMIPPLSQTFEVNKLTALNKKFDRKYSTNETYQFLDNGFMEYRLKREEQEIVNLPHYKDKIYIAKDFIGEILFGFEKGYKFCLSNKEELIRLTKQCINDNSFVRILFNNTSYYSSFLSLSYHPKLLSEANGRENFLLNIHNSQTYHTVNDGDYESLLNGDIPHWKILATSKKIMNEKNNELIYEFSDTPFEQFEMNFDKLTKQDLIFQKKLINSSFQTEFTELNITSLKEIETTFTEESSYDFEEKIDDFLYLLREQFKNNLDSVYNITFSLDENFIKKLDHSLYTGWIGIGLLSISRYASSNNKDFLEFANEIIDCYLVVPKNCNNLGVFSGCSSVLYLCEACFKITEDKQYLIKADQFLTVLSRRILCLKIPFYDIIDGFSGLAIVCLNLYNLSKNNVFLDFGKSFINRLIEVISEQTTAQKLITGFSHGMSGIMLALQYYQYSSNDFTYDSYIILLLNKENNHRHEWGWEDLREDSISYDTLGWCNGTPGILLSRYLLKKYESKLLFQKDIEIANELMSNRRFTRMNLCHGELGNALIKYYVTESSEDKDKLKQFIQQACFNSIKDICNYERINDFNLDLSLMTGITGVYYAYLFVNTPEKIPFVLSLSC